MHTHFNLHEEPHCNNNKESDSPTAPLTSLHVERPEDLVDVDPTLQDLSEHKVTAPTDGTDAHDPEPPTQCSHQKTTLTA